MSIAMRAVLASVRPEDLQALSDTIRRRYPGGEITLTAAVSRAEDLQRALTGGNFDLILTDLEMASLLGTWLRTRSTTARQEAVVVTRHLDDPRVERLRMLGAAVVTPGGLPDLLAHWVPVQTAPAPAAGSGSTAAAGGGPIARVITVHSPKGGAGSSTVAAHLAVSLARQGANTMLVDMALYGNAAAILKVQQRGHGLGELLSALEHEQHKVDSPEVAAILERCLVQVEVGGRPLWILPAAPPRRMYEIKGPSTEAFIAHLAAMPFDYVVIDTSSELSERTLATLATADNVLLLSTPEVTAAWNLFQLREVLGLISPKGQIALVVNRAGTQVEFDPDELSNLCGYRVAATLPDAGTAVTLLTNTGSPDHMKESHPFAKGIRQLAGLVGAVPQGGR
ncbi:MAG: AAA family ATPase [Bacillota bacterium]